MQRLAVSVFALLGTLLTPAAALAEEVSFIAFLSPGNEVPPIVDSQLSGVAQVVIDTTTNKARFEVYTFDLASGNALVASHIHRAPEGVNGPVIYPLATTAFTSPLTGEFDFNPADFSDLSSGGMYVNVHSTNHPSGESRGQLQPGTLTGRRLTFTLPLSPDNEVPPTDVDAGATALITLDLKMRGDQAVAGATSFNVDYQFGTSVTLVGLHVHKGPAGTNGPVVISSGLRPTGDADGRGNISVKVPLLSASGLATFDEILHDPTGFYVNLHTTANPSGAIRGQLRGGALPRPAGCPPTPQPLP